MKKEGVWCGILQPLSMCTQASVSMENRRENTWCNLPGGEKANAASPRVSAQSDYQLSKKLGGKSSMLLP